MGKGIFGGLFDFNKDGEMSTFERATEFAFLNDMLQKDTADSTDGGFADEEDDSWRDYCEDGSEYDIDPEDYETEEEYEEALEEAKDD